MPLPPKKLFHKKESQSCFSDFGISLEEKVKSAITFLQSNENSAISFNPKGYWLAFSGGKDSCVILKLAEMSGVRFIPVYNQTTIDPPELVRFIKQEHPNVQWERPKRNFFVSLYESHGLPTRISRWCCEEYKEHAGDDYVKIIGVRAAESARRRVTWKPITPHRDGKSGDRICPILYWEDEDVWCFIRKYKVKYCSLYNEGFKRLGCVGCPMAGKARVVEFARWPLFEKAWKVAAKKYYNMRKDKISPRGKPYIGLNKFDTFDDFWNWWMSDNPTKKETKDECLGLFDDSI